jgi:hypothetical protein
MGRWKLPVFRTNASTEATAMNALVAPSTLKDFKLPIEGMNCASCVVRVEKKFSGFMGAG